MTGDVFMMWLANPFVVYVAGMSLMVALAGMSMLAIRYYIKAKDMVPHLRKLDELREEIATLQKKSDDAAKALKEKMAEIAQAERLIQNGKDAENWLREKRDEIDSTRKLLERVRAEFETESVHKQDLDRQISERQQIMIDLEKKAVDAEWRMDDARKEEARLRVEVPRLQKEAELAGRQIEEKRAELDGLGKQLEEVAGKINKANGELERLSGRIEARRKELEQLENAADAAKKSLDDIRRKTVELEAKADVASGTIARLDATRDGDGDKWKNLDTPLVNIKNLREADGNMDEAKWLDEFSGRLEKHGFIFDERAIKAFHTSLKCARQTPLAVLSGISGTGKSLLPELYAAALGANFLSVPVQPRWDSPQDLFGFYNYMEGRYKATELARLLWQFDAYNNPDAKEWKKGGALPLNIVLLDEMNLARVEYYFSDLLSRLETRNGIDPGNEIERRKAEIEIECNAAGGRGSMRHLFVAPHTLFVGTMNEDESTQALSDKVLDRANVLQFGLPGTLADAKAVTKAPDKDAFVKSWQGGRRACARGWDKWCKPLSQATDGREEIDFLNRTARPVLMALDKVNRAYGYRVDQAMKLYVLNYPGNWKHAVSDQLEMKILPKLNGVELQDERFAEVRKAVEEAIASTGDERLENAFDASCKADATFFKWRGVMR
ncbi:MAG: AAA family ATPase [Kiritimatiellae bacterium]|nr:AAA family ATPase [Kiritimatiellia bacterium]